MADASVPTRKTRRPVGPSTKISASTKDQPSKEVPISTESASNNVSAVSNDAGDINNADVVNTEKELVLYSVANLDVPVACHGLVPLLQRLVDAQGNREQELKIGREVRLSRRFRHAITEAISSLLIDIGNKPDSISDILRYVRDCNRLMTLSNLSEEVDQSFLLLIPREIRDLIWGMLIGNPSKYYQEGFCGMQTESDHYDSKKKNGKMKKNYCDSSATYKKPSAAKHLDLSFLRVSKQVNAEITPLIYRQKHMIVTCTCKLFHMLSRQDIRNSIRTLDFGLFGSQRLEAIDLLYQCPKLENVGIVIARKSSHVLTAEERYIRACEFVRSNKRPRLTDALGVAELKGFGFKKNIKVKVSRVSPERTEMERQAFEDFINLDPDRTLPPGSPGYGDNSDEEEDQNQESGDVV